VPARLSRRIAIRSEEPLLRSQIDARESALDERGSEAGEEDAPRAAGRIARPTGAREHAPAAAGQPAIDHAGCAGRVEVHRETAAQIVGTQRSRRAIRKK